jgi:hypothetical protein
MMQSIGPNHFFALIYAPRDRTSAQGSSKFLVTLSLVSDSFRKATGVGTPRSSNVSRHLLAALTDQSLLQQTTSMYIASNKRTVTTGSSWPISLGAM